MKGFLHLNFLANIFSNLPFRELHCFHTTHRGVSLLIWQVVFHHQVMRMWVTERYCLEDKCKFSERIWQWLWNRYRKSDSLLPCLISERIRRDFLYLLLLLGFSFFTSSFPSLPPSFLPSFLPSFQQTQLFSFTFLLLFHYVLKAKFGTCNNVKFY